MERKFLIGGSGGQGILFLGKVIANAAMLAGKEVTWFPSYGAEMRSGAANCTVIVSDEIIGSPILTYADYLIVFTEAALNKFVPRLKEDGMLFYDSSFMTFDFNGHFNGYVESMGVKASIMASEIGSTRVANMIMLGVLAASTGIFSIEELLLALEGDTSECMLHNLSLNKRALLRGFEIIENKKSNRI
ncbi:MAG: 2-oxoacid:acceptor oxidoreductase family protein [Nitrospirae bacterium]|nr:2-oxoacid:acceptor oxidoreductase family protein [Nitrospirota bacterium]